MESERFELVQGALWVNVVDHTLDLAGSPVRCWTAATEGLSRNGQRELIVSIPNRDGVDFPVGVFHFFTTVDKLASDGRLVGSGGVTTFGPPGPFDFGAFLGAVYAPATGDHRIPQPPGALQVVLLRDAELEMANRCSSWRVLARLGEISRFFPWPFWSDPMRPSAYQLGDAAQSLLARVPRLSIGRLDATVTGDRLQVTLNSAEARMLASDLEERGYGVLVPDPDPASRGTLVWSPGQSEPRAICLDPANTPFVSARFLMIVTGQSQRDVVQFQEDGWSILTAPGTGDVLLRNLVDGQDSEISGDRHVAIRIT